MDFDPSLQWRDVTSPGFNAHIGPIRIAQISDELFAATLEIRDIHCNIGGVCHGGVLMSLADTAMGSAAYIAGGEHPCATITFDSQFLAGAKPGKTLYAQARVLRRVRELCFVDCMLSAGGRNVLRASGTWKYLASRSPGTPYPASE